MESEVTRNTIIATILSIWKNTDRPTITLDSDTYQEYFPYLKPSLTIHDSKTKEPVFSTFNREYAIKEVKSRSRMLDGS